MEMVADGNAASAARRRRGGCGLALGRLVRKLRRQSKMLCTAAAARPSGAGASSRRCQYDPLSYARNFDRSGFGTALDDDDVSHYYTFASRFVLASSSSSSSSSARQP